MGKLVVDATQMREEDGEWSKEPREERHPDLAVHTQRPYNAEPPNYALTSLVTPETLHYRRTHAPVPLVDVEAYRVHVGVEDGEMMPFSMADIRELERVERHVTMMCTGNRRSEFNNPVDGETMGLPWKNGSISTALWGGCFLSAVLKAAGIGPDMEDEGYPFVTLYGVENYHISVPLQKVLDKKGDVLFAYQMNGHDIPRDHGFPLRVIVPGYVGARSVKWIDRVLVCKEQCEGTHQRGIAYKQLPPNTKSLVGVPPHIIEELPPIDWVPVLSAITQPDPGACAAPGCALTLQGYAYSGNGLAIIRVDVSLDGGKTWTQGEIERASGQGVRSRCAWAWVQWRLCTKVPLDASSLEIYCKAVDDQYNQQPHDTSSIWNLRGILNTSWGHLSLKVSSSVEVTEEARSGDSTVASVGIKMSGDFQCPDCVQKFTSEKALDLHCKFFHDPTRRGG